MTRHNLNPAGHTGAPAPSTASSRADEDTAALAQAGQLAGASRALPNQRGEYGAGPPVPPTSAGGWATEDGDDALAPPAAASLLAEPEVYSTRDVARIFGRTERTVRNWVRAGRLRPVRVGGSVFFTRATLDALLAGEPHGPSPGQYGSSH